MKKTLFLVALFFWGIQGAWAEVKSKVVPYEYGGVTMKGYLAWDDSLSGKRPGILLVHEWWVLNDYARTRADQLAKLGYVVFAADMYGEGKSTEHPEEAGKMSAQVRENLPLWIGRASAALKALRDSELVDPTRLAAIGYCFGGATALQLAYSGADLDAVVSFHGALPVPETTKNIKARILILHGAADTFTTEDTIKKFKATLDAGGVKYKFVAYPGAVHSFTDPDADKRGVKGIAYNAAADKQSWQEMLALFQEVFAQK